LPSTELRLPIDAGAGTIAEAVLNHLHQVAHELSASHRRHLLCQRYFVQHSKMRLAKRLVGVVVASAFRNRGDNGRYTVCCASLAICDAGVEAYAVDPAADHCTPWKDVPWQRAWAPGGAVPNQAVCDEL
jgi:hypothetical protein